MDMDWKDFYDEYGNIRKFSLLDDCDVAYGQNTDELVNVNNTFYKKIQKDH